MTSTKRRRAGRGFTLVEVMVVLPLVSLLMIGAFSLFLMSLQLGSKANAELTVTQDAANAIQQIVEVGREANAVALVDAGGLSATQAGMFTSAPSKYQPGAGNYSTLLNGQTLYTGILVTMPAALQTSDVASYAGAGWSYITLRNNQGATLPATQSAPIPFAPYNCSSTGPQTSFLVYRADRDGTPNPVTGGFLWERPLPYSPNTVGFPLCRTVATGAPNAVQFVQPQAASEIEVKIVSGAYSAINGTQTDEEGNGTFTSQLVGKCILMRDRNPSSTAQVSGTTSTYNPYQAH